MSFTDVLFVAGPMVISFSAGWFCRRAWSNRKPTPFQRAIGGAAMGRHRFEVSQMHHKEFISGIAVGRSLQAKN